MFSCRKKNRTQYLKETVQCRFTTNSIISFGRAESIFHTKLYSPVRITMSCHCPRHLKLKGMGHVRLSCQFWLATTYGVVSASCLLSRGVMPCRASPCHALSNNITVVIRKAPPRSRRPATWRETHFVQFDSGTVPHQLENNSLIIFRAPHGFPPGNKNTQKEQIKRTTTRRRQLLTPLCKATSVATTSACSEQLLNTHQMRCLHSFCESCGAGVSHLVLFKIEFGERGVRLVILHTSDSPCQRTSGCSHACYHTPLQQRSPSSSQGNELRDWAESVRRDVSFLFFASLNKYPD